MAQAYLKSVIQCSYVGELISVRAQMYHNLLLICYYIQNMLKFLPNTSTFTETVFEPAGFSTVKE